MKTSPQLKTTYRASISSHIANGVLTFMRALRLIAFVFVLPIPLLSYAETLIECEREECDLRIVNLQSPEADFDAENGIRVTGTYSSGDVFGIEGLAIVDGQMVTNRFQGWDGVLISQGGAPEIHVKTNVPYDGTDYDLTDREQRNSFIERAKEDTLSVLQFHLVVRDGKLDIRPTDNERKFVRRFFYTKADSFGIYQTEKALSFYEGSKDLFDTLEPDMAINLDMGAYDYCEEKIDGTIKTCGTPLAGLDKLTNVLEISK